VQPPKIDNYGYHTLQHRLSIPTTIQQQINGCFTLDRLAGKRRNRPLSQSIVSSISTAAFPINAYDTLATIKGLL
jgi:hypothetical protein